jgi:hypothetical protein
VTTGGEPYGIEDAFRIWVNRQPRGKGHMGNRVAIIKQGRDVIKTVEVANYGDKAAGEIKKRELRFRTYRRRKDDETGWGFDSPDPKTTWWCENEEVERLLSFLGANVAKTGRYRVVDTESASGAVLSLLSNGDVDSQTLAEALIRHGDIRKLVGLLAASDAGLSVAQSAVVARRRDLVTKLQAVIQDPTKTETHVQRLIGDAYWIFGGRYVGVANRRNLMSLDQHDIPLLGADGTLHIVELKSPSIPKLVRTHRNHWIVGDDVHEAVGQAMNYVRAFDELGASHSSYYRNELGRDYDMRRVFATVVIGHPKHVRAVGKDGQVVDERTIQQTIRCYNAHLSRVEVMTYKDLADTAERALAFEKESTLAPTTERLSAEQSDDPWAHDDRPWAANSDPWGSDAPSNEAPF